MGSLGMNSKSSVINQDYFSKWIPRDLVVNSAEKHFYGSFSIDGRWANERDLLGIFDLDTQRPIGYSTSVSNGNYRGVVYGDDWKTSEKEWGCDYGSGFSLKAINMDDGILRNVHIRNGMPVFRGNLADELNINAFQAPEPLTLGLLGLGSLALRLKKKKNK